MVSCTEFIPLYSELFQYIEDEGGHEAVERYWQYVSDVYVAGKLGALAAFKGIAGCWDYWSHSLNEEAADFTMTFDSKEQTFEIDMHHCPSKGMLLDLKQMEPYHDYCGHCAVLYSQVLKRYGIENADDYSHVDEARCVAKYFVPKKDKTEAK